MRLGVAPHRLWPAHEDELDGVLETARTAEELGFDHLIASSHLLAGAVGVTPDPLVLLSAVAGATTRIRLVTSVLILPLYQPVVVAHQTATLDRLSGGRFTLGVGTGWDTAEFAAAGVPFAGRGRRADEQLEIVRKLWRDEAEVRLGVRPRTPGGHPCGSAATAMRPSGGRCGTATPGTAPGWKRPDSPRCGAGWLCSGRRRGGIRPTSWSSRKA